MATRLWKGGRGANVTLVDNSHEVELGKYGKITINYWMMEPISDSGGKSKWRDIKKGYVSGNSAVFITLNGQRHGSENYSFLKDKVGLSYSSNYVLVQIDCDNLTKVAKKNLLSSTRERLKEGEMKEILLTEVANNLKDDTVLMNFERERKKRILSADVKRDTSKIRNMVGRIVSKNEILKDLILKEGSERVQNTKQPKMKKDEEEGFDNTPDEEELVPPNLNDIPTYIKITNKKQPIHIEKGGNAQIRLEIDAINEYLSDENFVRLKVSYQKSMMKRKSYSKLRNGKMSYRVLCPSSVRIGSKEKIVFKLDRPNDEPLSVETELVCVKPFKRKKTKTERKIREPKILFVKKGESRWEELDFTEKSVGQIYIDTEDAAIMISLDNEHLLGVIDKYGSKETLDIDTIYDRYAMAISYYLILRYVDNEKIKKSEKAEIDDSHDSLELQRLAGMVSWFSLPPGVI